jgi:hypothetical protein
MPSKAFVAAAVFIAIGAATIPAGAQTPEPENAQPEAPETTAPDTTAPETTAPEPAGGPSHRITGAAVVFNLIDGDGDGEIDLGEASKLFEAMFTTLDADDDGKLSKAEINSAIWRMRGGRGDSGYHHDHEEDHHYEEEDDDR